MELEQLSDPTHHSFFVPGKRINDGNDLQFFFTSTAYRDLSTWLYQLSKALFPKRNPDGTVVTFAVDSLQSLSRTIQSLASLLASFSELIGSAPPDTGPRRFGNVAFRKWYQLADEKAAELIDTHLHHILERFGSRSDVISELRSYLLGAFGSAQRLDYGTGHELSFLAFLGCLWKLQAFEHGEEAGIVLAVIQPYLTLIRKLIMTYTLEPAGSHGVWGLDDHSFVPYIFGSAQLGPAMPSDGLSPVPTEGSIDSAPLPSSVMSRPTVTEYRDSNMYFSAINFIYEVKKGPFWEHSPVLYDVSGITDGWGKINKGMLKMYAAEVLGKFPVVQHFPFGSLFQWETDPAVKNAPPSIHAQQQPRAMQSKDVPPVAPGQTAAPWASRSGVGGGGVGGGGGGRSIPSMSARTGPPSARAPWAATGMPGHRTSGSPGTSAPWSRGGIGEGRAWEGRPERRDGGT